MNETMNMKNADNGMNLEDFLNLESLPEMTEFWPDDNNSNPGYVTDEHFSNELAPYPSQTNQEQGFEPQQQQFEFSDSGDASLYPQLNDTGPLYQPIPKTQLGFDLQTQPDVRQYPNLGGNQQQDYYADSNCEYQEASHQASRIGSRAASRTPSRQEIPAIVLQTTVSEEPQNFLAANTQMMNPPQPSQAEINQQSQHLRQHSGSLASFSDYSYGSVPSPLSTAGTPIGSPIPFPDDTGLMPFNEPESFGELDDFGYKPREAGSGFYQQTQAFPSSPLLVSQHASQRASPSPGQLERIRSAVDNSNGLARSPLYEASNHQQQLRRVESYAGVSQITRLQQGADGFHLELPVCQPDGNSVDGSDSAPSAPPSPGTSSPLPSGRLRSSSNVSLNSTGRPRSASSPSPSITGVGRRRSQKGPSIYACELCDKRFTRTYNLRSHLRTHTDERPFLCAICGKAFSRQHDRRRHEELHSGEKRFQCGGQIFGTGAKTQPDDEPCDKGDGRRWGCGRKFARSDALGRHLRTDNGKHCLEPVLQAIQDHLGDRSQPVEGLVYMGDSDSSAPRFELVDREGVNASRRSVIASALTDLLAEQK